MPRPLKISIFFLGWYFIALSSYVAYEYNSNVKSGTINEISSTTFWQAEFESAVPDRVILKCFLEDGNYYYTNTGKCRYLFGKVTRSEKTQHPSNRAIYSIHINYRNILLASIFPALTLLALGLIIISYRWAFRKV